MNSSTRNQYRPDYAAPPGETLLEALEARAMSQAELAERTGRPTKTINEIIQGKTAITPDTALQLERVLNIPTGFWIKLEADYQEHLARKKDHEILKSQTDWLKEIPIKDMIKAGWLSASNNKIEQLQNALQYFGVASPQAWRQIWLANHPGYLSSAAYVKNPGAVATWLRAGELEAQQLQCTAYDKSKFSSILGQIRKLIDQPQEVVKEKLAALGASAGVAIVFTDSIATTPIQAATRWLSPQKAIIQLSSSTQASNAQFWFTFFHAAGHILLHGKRDYFIEDGSRESLKESEASEFANNILMPEQALIKLLTTQDFSTKAINQFAREIGVTPDIVTSQLEHRKVIPISNFAKAKIKLKNI